MNDEEDIQVVTPLVSTENFNSNESVQDQEDQEEQDQEELVQEEEEEEEVKLTKKEADQLLSIEDDADTTDDEYYRKQNQFNFSKYILQFAHPIIIKNYIYMLENYQYNTIETNDCILRILEKIAFERELYAMFFQLYIFYIFDLILQDVTIKNNPLFKRLRSFCKSIMYKFFELANKNPMLYIEILFWKSMSYADHLTLDNKVILTHKGTYKNQLANQHDQHILSSDDSDTEEEIAQDENHLILKDLNDITTNLSNKIWTFQEDTLLKTEYINFIHDEACYEILSSMLGTHTAEQVKRRIYKLKLHQTVGTINSLKSRLSTKKSKNAIQMLQAKQEQINQIIYQFKSIYSMSFIDQMINFLTQQLNFIKDNRIVSCKDHLTLQQISIVTTSALIPINEFEFKAIEILSEELLEIFQFVQPNSAKVSYWRIPSSLSDQYLDQITISLATAVQHVMKNEPVAVEPVDDEAEEDQPVDDEAEEDQPVVDEAEEDQPVVDEAEEDQSVDDDVTSEDQPAEHVKDKKHDDVTVTSEDKQSDLGTNSKRKFDIGEIASPFKKVKI